MSSFQMNQMALTALKGELDKNFSAFTMPVQLDPASVNTLVPGDAVKISTAAGAGCILVEKCVATDNPFGFVMYNNKKSSWAAGDALEIALPGSVLVLEANAAITRGAQLEYVPTGAKVKTNVGNPLCGVALDSAASSGDLVRVLVVSSVAVPLALVGGSVNNSPVGATTASTGKFTTVEFLRTLGVAVALTPGATPALDASLATNFTLTPGEDETINASNIKAGQDVFILVTTSGTTSRTLTFGTGFTSTGTLATGTVSAKKFLLHFRAFADGALTEVSRTTAM